MRKLFGSARCSGEGSRVRQAAEELHRVSCAEAGILDVGRDLRSGSHCCRLSRVPVGVPERNEITVFDFSPPLPIGHLVGRIFSTTRGASVGDVALLGGRSFGSRRSRFLPLSPHLLPPHYSSPGARRRESCPVGSMSRQNSRGNVRGGSS